MTTEVNNDTAQKNLLSLSDKAEVTVFLYLVNCNLVNAYTFGGRGAGTPHEKFSQAT